MFPSLLIRLTVSFTQVSTSAGVDRSYKAAPLPAGISEMKDQPMSGGGSQGLIGGDNEGTTGGGSGKGPKDGPIINRVAEDLQGEENT